MNIFIDSSSPVSVYKQIKNQIKGLALSGELEPGTILPSIRVLASYLEVAINTVARAYYELSDEKIIKLDGRRGSVINDIDETDKDKQKALFINELAEEFLLRSKEYGYSKDDLIEVISRKYTDIY